jgi:hypothetical protein
MSPPHPLLAAHTLTRPRLRPRRPLRLRPHLLLLLTAHTLRRNLPHPRVGPSLTPSSLVLLLLLQPLQFTVLHLFATLHPTRPRRVPAVRRPQRPSRVTTVKTAGRARVVSATNLLTTTTRARRSAAAQTQGVAAAAGTVATRRTRRGQPTRHLVSPSLPPPLPLPKVARPTSRLSSLSALRLLAKHVDATTAATRPCHHQWF